MQIGHVAAVPERDENKEALEQVEKATESEPVKGEDLLESVRNRAKMNQTQQLRILWDDL